MDPSAPRAPLLRAFADLVDSLEFFLNAYALSNRSCQIVVIYNSRDESRVIFPSKESDSDNISHDSIKVELNKLLVTNANSGSSSSSSSDGNKTEGAPICRAFSRALCLISRRVRRSAGRLRPRILVVQGTREHAIAFNSIMNSVFSANKLGVMIDALVLSLKESLFLQQACLITNGTYVSPQDNSANLLQTLLTNFIPNADLREVFERPIPRSIKMRYAALLIYASMLKPLNYCLLLIQFTGHPATATIRASSSHTCARSVSVYSAVTT